MRWIGCGFVPNGFYYSNTTGLARAHRAGMKGVGGAVRDGQGSRPFRGNAKLAYQENAVALWPRTATAELAEP